MARSRWAGVFLWTDFNANFGAHRVGSSAIAGSLPLSTTMASKEPEGIVWAAIASRQFATTCGRLRVGMMTLEVELSITWFHVAGFCRR